MKLILNLMKVESSKGDYSEGEKGKKKKEVEVKKK